MRQKPSLTSIILRYLSSFIYAYMWMCISVTVLHHCYRLWVLVALFFFQLNSKLNIYSLFLCTAWLMWWSDTHQLIPSTWTWMNLSKLAWRWGKESDLLFCTQNQSIPYSIFEKDDQCCNFMTLVVYECKIVKWFWITKIKWLVLWYICHHCPLFMLHWYALNSHIGTQNCNVPWIS